MVNKAVKLVETGRYEEESYTNVMYDIVVDGDVVGDCDVLVDDEYAYCERIDIHDDMQNKGYGTSALNELSRMYDGIVVSPDNEDATRLYRRLGSDYNGESADYIDNGYGVYII